ncbi:hypothetical protein [Brevundimonas naejangsanensis]|uniref:hypothetical protein n=1 Tax=Brevundimonas naejangsanensis TaxID=588932 RepID=UPI0026EE9129|nr:hypothetical protein [Brevundimonas naejangsanensis]
MLASLALSLLVMLSAPSSPTENGRPRPGPKATVPTQTIEKARQRLDNDLGDYPSARFRNVIAQGEADRAKFCGEINSRNRMGGMTGWQRFYLDPDIGLPIIINPATSCETSIDGADYSSALTYSATTQ